MLADETQGIVPRGNLPHVALLDHRHAETVRVIQTLKRSLATRAQPATIERMLRIALELDGAAVAGFGDDPTGR